MVLKFVFFPNSELTEIVYFNQKKLIFNEISSEILGQMINLNLNFLVLFIDLGDGFLIL